MTHWVKRQCNHMQILTQFLLIQCHSHLLPLHLITLYLHTHWCHSLVLYRHFVSFKRIYFCTSNMVCKVRNCVCSCGVPASRRHCEPVVCLCISLISIITENNPVKAGNVSCAILAFLLFQFHLQMSMGAATGYL